MLAMILGHSATFGQVIVVPDAFANLEASIGDTQPLGVELGRFQQVFGPSLLGQLNVGDQISGLTFRVDGPDPTVPSQIVANYEIRMSTSANPPGSLSPTFAANRGADEVIVRSGPLVIGPDDFPGGGSPNPFGVMIPFATPFVYAGGPLLIEIAHDGFPAGWERRRRRFPDTVRRAGRVRFHILVDDRGLRLSPGGHRLPVPGHGRAGAFDALAGSRPCRLARPPLAPSAVGEDFKFHDKL